MAIGSVCFSAHFGASQCVKMSRQSVALAQMCPILRGGVVLYQRPEAPPPPNLPPPPDLWDPPELLREPPDLCELDPWPEDEPLEMQLLKRAISSRILTGSWM